MPTSEVTIWLEKNEAGEYAQKFADAGYIHLADVTADAIDELIPKDKPGIATHLKNALPAPKKQGDPLAPPQLPVGTTLDLSVPDPKVPDFPDWKLPQGLSESTGSGPVVSPNSLTSEDWMVLAKNSHMLYGYTMDSTGPKEALEPVRYWRVPGDVFFRSEELEACISTSLNYTETTAAFVRDCADTESATASYTFCSASFERSHQEHQAGSQYSKTLYMTGMWRFPRATVLLDRCTVVSPNFVDAVRDALKGGTQDQDVRIFWKGGFNWQEVTKYEVVNVAGVDFVKYVLKQDGKVYQDIGAATVDWDATNAWNKGGAWRLEKVFNDYGHAVPQVAVIGGQLLFQSIQKANGKMETSTVQDTIKAAVEIKACGASASAGGSYQDGEGKTVTAAQIATNVEFRARGGDTTKAGAPAAWSDTVKDPHLWFVIALSELRDDLTAPSKHPMISTVELLRGLPPELLPGDQLKDPPKDLRQQVLELWEPLARLWKAGLGLPA